jgi:hypothetical protein
MASRRAQEAPIYPLLLGRRLECCSKAPGRPNCSAARSILNKPFLRAPAVHPGFVEGLGAGTVPDDEVKIARVTVEEAEPVHPEPDIPEQ